MTKTQRKIRLAQQRHDRRDNGRSISPTKPTNPKHEPFPHHGPIPKRMRAAARKRGGGDFTKALAAVFAEKHLKKLKGK